MKGMVRVHEVQRQHETQEFPKNLLTPWLVQVSNSLIQSSDLKTLCIKDIQPYTLSSRLHRKLPITLLAVLSELLVIYIFIS